MEQSWTLVVVILNVLSTVPSMASPVQIFFTDQTHSITVGSEVHLTCVAKGDIPFYISWFTTTSADGSLPTNAHADNNGRTLVLRNYTPSNEGNYTCVAFDLHHQVNHTFHIEALKQTTMSHAQQLTTPATITTIKQPSSYSAQIPTRTSVQAITFSTTMKLSSQAKSKAKATSSALSSSTNGQTKQPTGPFCMSCEDITKPKDCNTVVHCYDDEKCGMKQQRTPNGVVYQLGCQKKRTCTMIGQEGHLIGRKSVRDINNFQYEADDTHVITTCNLCCTGDVCNRGGMCGTQDYEDHGGRICFSCTQQNTTDDCRKIELCRYDQMCYIGESLAQSWQTGCINTSNCTKLNQGSKCQQCCRGNLCNRKCTSPTGTQQTTISSTTTTKSTTTVTTTPLPCVDQLQGGCAKYDPILCTALPSTREFSIKFCAKTCNLCSEYIAYRHKNQQQPYFG